MLSRGNQTMDERSNVDVVELGGECSKAVFLWSEIISQLTWTAFQSLHKSSVFRNTSADFVNGITVEDAQFERGIVGDALTLKETG